MPENGWIVGGDYASAHARSQDAHGRNLAAVGHFPKFASVLGTLARGVAAPGVTFRGADALVS